MNAATSAATIFFQGFPETRTSRCDRRGGGRGDCRLVGRLLPRGWRFRLGQRLDGCGRLGPGHGPIAGRRLAFSSGPADKAANQASLL